MLSVTAPRFVAGLILNDDRVTEAAPILRYMTGWTRARVLSYCRSRRWALTEVEP